MNQVIIGKFIAKKRCMIIIMGIAMMRVSGSILNESGLQSLISGIITVISIGITLTGIIITLFGQKQGRDKYHNAKRYSNRLIASFTVIAVFVSAAIMINVLIHIISLNNTSVPSVYAGNYYLDGDNTNASIQVISNNQLILNGFDISTLVEDIEYGTGLSGQYLYDFREVQNLYFKYSGIIDFRVELLRNNEFALFLFPNDNLGFFIIILDANTLSFNGNKYIRP